MSRPDNEFQNVGDAMNLIGRDTDGWKTADGCR
jgi:hypothetical protein